MANIIKKAFVLNAILFTIWLFNSQNKWLSLFLLGLMSVISMLTITYIALYGLTTRALFAYISYLSKKQMNENTINSTCCVSAEVLQHSYVLYNRTHIYVFNCRKHKFFWQNPYKLIAIFNYTDDTMRKILKAVKHNHVQFVNNYIYVGIPYPNLHWAKLIIDFSAKMDKSKQIKQFNSIMIQSILYLLLGITALISIISITITTIFMDYTLVLTFMYTQSIGLMLFFSIQLCLFLIKKVRKKLVKKAKSNNAFFATSYIIDAYNYYLQPIEWKMNSKSQYSLYAIYAYQKTPENLAHLHPKEIKQSIVYDYTNSLPDCIHHF